MLMLLAIVASFALSYAGFNMARNFVRNRLRFVEAAQRASAPILAAVGAFVVASPVTWILPLVGAGTALAFGVSVGFGVASGQRDIRNNTLPPSF
jgi:hypothetical protein